MRNLILYFLLSSIFFSCEYEQDYYDVTLSLTNNSFYLSPAESSNPVFGGSSSDPLIVSIKGGAKKALYYPVLARYHNGVREAILNFDVSYLDSYNDCCFDGIYYETNSYQGDLQGIICNCEEDGLITHDYLYDYNWQVGYEPNDFYRTDRSYKVILIDPYIDQEGSRTNNSKRRYPNNYNIIVESEEFTFYNSTGSGGSGGTGGSSSSYNCINGTCVTANGGQFSSLTACISACNIPSSWDCDGNGNCFDPGDGNGQYSSFSSCQSNCVPPPPPNDPCFITASNNHTPYTMSLSPWGGVYNFGDQITIQMNHPSYSYGQGNIELYLNENYVAGLGSASVFTNNSRTVTLPTLISPSNCYTIRVTGTAGGPNAYFNVSSPITIY